MPIPWNVALAAVGDDQALLREVVQVLAEDLPRLRQSVGDAVAADDRDAIRRAAHSLKGSLRFMGDTAPHDLAQQLEQHASSPNSTSATNIQVVWEELSVALDRLARSLDLFLQTPQGDKRSMQHDSQ